MERKCENCVHLRLISVRKDDVIEGECRANPPTYHPSMARGQWPETRGYEWCGKFEERKVPLPKNELDRLRDI